MIDHTILRSYSNVVNPPRFQFYPRSRFARAWHDRKIIWSYDLDCNFNKLVGSIIICDAHDYRSIRSEANILTPAVLAYLCGMCLIFVLSNCRHGGPWRYGMADSVLFAISCNAYYIRLVSAIGCNSTLIWQIFGWPP